MRLSGHLVVVPDRSNSDCFIIYNRRMNKMVSVHKLVYQYLKTCEELDDFDEILNDLSSEQVKILIENYILIQNEDDCERNPYRRVRKNFPKDIFSAYLHLTMKCNLKCSYCYQRDNIGQQNTLSYKEWIKIIDELYKAGAKNLIITGGEPLLYSGIEQVLERAKFYNMRVTLLTNGMMLRKFPEVLKYIDKIIVSLDGLEEGERKGLNAELVLDNVFWIFSTMSKNIVVRSVVKRGKEDSVEELSLLLNTKGIPHLKVICMPYTMDEIKNIPDFCKYNLTAEECMNAECGAGNVIISVDHEGNVFPCQVLMKKEFYITNILKSSWYQEYRENRINDQINCFDPYENETCKTCDYIHFCNGSCGANVYNVYGTFDRRPDFLCDFLRKSGERYLGNAK